MNINALRQRRAEAAKALSKLLADHTTAATASTPVRGFSPDEKTAQADARQDIANLDELIAAEAARIELDKDRVNAGATPRIEVGRDLAAEKPWNTGPKGLGEFAKAVRHAQTGNGIDPRLYNAAGSGMNEAVGGDGGFAVPVEFATEIERGMFQTGAILSRVDARNISGNAMSYTLLKETSRADGSRQGGVLGYWIDEGEAPDATKIQTRKMELKLRKVGTLGYMTEELEQDALALGEELQFAFTEELQFQVENKVWRGPGAGSPKGFTVSDCFISVAKEAGQAAASVVPMNISKMWSRLPARSKLNAVWLGNVDVEPQLDLLTHVPAGTTTAVAPGSSFVQNGPGGITIKGRPFIPVEYAETCGTLGDLVLVDLKQYRLIKKAAGVQMASSMFVRFVQGENTYRGIFRVDGQPKPESALTPFKGSNTISPFIGLATRA